MELNYNLVTQQQHHPGDEISISHTEPSFSQGMIIRKDRGRYDVVCDGRVMACAVSNRIHKQLLYPTADPASLPQRVQKVITLDHVDPLAVGDQVQFITAPDGSGLIVEVLPRRSKLTRRTAVPMPTANPFEQVIVANIDQVAPVFAAANPPPKWNMLDRYLVSAESLSLPSLVVITKADLAKGDGGSLDGNLDQVLQEYRHIGYHVIVTSIVNGQGLDELKEALHDRITVLVGKSGVGKTSLLNALQPGLGLRVNEVSQATGKGKHTTTNMQMFSLNIGGAIVDTPGMREFGLWEAKDQDMALFFPEMKPFVGTCKFGLDCHHKNEPGCAIRKAVSEGLISSQRYQSFLGLGWEPHHGR
jgi:ribosome biogenesis GTPase